MSTSTIIKTGLKVIASIFLMETGRKLFNLI